MGSGSDLNPILANLSRSGKRISLKKTLQWETVVLSSRFYNSKRHNFKNSRFLKKCRSNSRFSNDTFLGSTSIQSQILSKLMKPGPNQSDFKSDKLLDWWTHRGIPGSGSAAACRWCSLGSRGTRTSAPCAPSSWRSPCSPRSWNKGRNRSLSYNCCYWYHAWKSCYISYSCYDHLWDHIV